MTTSFDMVDRALEGGLKKRLRAMRADGLTIDEMTARFTQEGYAVSRETVRRWCHRAGIPTHRVPA